MKKLLLVTIPILIVISTTTAQIIQKPTNAIKKNVTLQQQTERNTPVQKLPDLRITSVNVKHISPPSGGKYLEISYTVKNDGTAPVDLSKINMSGRIKTSPTSIREDGGCGKDCSVKETYLCGETSFN